MRSLKILGIAFFAVLAFGAISAMSASATLWLINGVSPSSETSTTTHGLLLLHHEGGLGGEFTVDCTGLFIGSVGPGALDLITLVEGLKGEKDLVTCNFVSPTPAGNGCGNLNELIIVHAVKLEPPWHSLLVLNGSVTEDRILFGEWEFLCPAGLKLTGTCEGEAWATFTGNGTNGATFAYEEKEPGAKCSDGGTGKVLKGSKGELLSGVTVS